MTCTNDWLAGYLKAWETKAEDDVRALFTDDAEYWFRPNDPEPVRGIDAIVEAWQEPEPGVPVPRLAVLIENERLGIIKGSVDYPGHETYTNLWEVWFAPDGRALRFVEWYMTPRAAGS
ncbi:nuclear transport factor 2 family protein [Demequina mangrovi]|uniref:SnoaL-like domain-containing protein n=1 Tax=Demequina mangrovi TaxID=1043493 RepID=A0A1H7AE79_9MICO|nr:nuclear transport factor 2 family protein [Demequina mangrovi]SEJ63246.1 SnoaL-like domain-containing protein [Demequina mangrovi]